MPDADDPHIHVDVKLNADAATRDLVARNFGLAGDLPGTVTTGCGLTVQRLRTSPRPDRVTCLACREYAGRQLSRHADQVERLGGLPGSVTTAQARAMADRLRHLAREFTGHRP